MDALSVPIGLSMIAAALLIAGSAVPLTMGWTQRNRWYGMRLTASMSSDEAWDAVNRYGGRQLIAASVPILIVGVVALLMPLKQHPVLVMLCPAVVLGGVITAAVRTVIFDAAYRDQARNR